MNANDIAARLERGETLRHLIDQVYAALGIAGDRSFRADMNDFIAVDAWESFAVALVGRVRPGDDIDLELRHGIGGFATDATIYGGAYGPDEGKSWKAWAPSPAAALVAALLKAGV